MRVKVTGVPNNEQPGDLEAGEGAHVTLTTEFQTGSGSNVGTKTVSRELHEMGFHGRAAAHKTKITMHNTKCRLEWCKAPHHWTLEEWKHVL